MSPGIDRRFSNLSRQEFRFVRKWQRHGKVGGVTEPSAPRATPDLEGVRVLVTGGTSGLGFAMSQALAQAGAEVVLTGRTGPRVQDAASRIGGGPA